MTNKIFLDTSYAIALSVSSDANHALALQIAGKLEHTARLFTTRAIFLEIGNALAKKRYRNAAVRLLTALENDPTIEIIEVSNELYTRSFGLFQSRSDKDWGIIDCISFTVMKDLAITEALSADVHFEQAGFRALLRN